MDRLSRRGFVYFIQAIDGGLIKIGFSTDLYGRIQVFRKMSPVPIRLVASFAGTMASEKAMHARFASLREHGEWFRPEPELIACIDEVKKSATTVTADIRGIAAATTAVTFQIYRGHRFVRWPARRDT